MRRRGFSILVAAALAVSVQAHAAPSVSVIAVAINGKSIIFSSSNNKLVYKASLTAAPIQPKVTCYAVTPQDVIVAGPPAPPIHLTGRVITIAAVKGSKWYYFAALAIGPPAAKMALAVLVLGVANSPNSLPCGGPYIGARAAGVAVIR